MKSIKLAALQRLARSVGLQSSGTKSTLAGALHAHLSARRALHPAAAAADAAPSVRLLSIDMGIQNLAYCLLECDTATLHRGSPAPAAAAADEAALFAGLAANTARVISRVRVTHWSRLAALSAPAPAASAIRTPFDIAALAAAASRLTRTLFLPLAPTAVLIERQRHRSGGAPAVLESTFRVNMLEAMLWAALAALRDDATAAAEGHADSALAALRVRSVDPKRMSNFWLPEGAGDAEAKVASAAKARALKEARVGLVAAWLRGGAVRVAGEAVDTRGRFLTAQGGGRRTTGEGRLKRDDLADCLLQGMAYACWESNAAYLAGQPLLEELGAEH